MNLPTPMPPEAQGELLQEVGGHLIAVAPEGWIELRYWLAMTATFSSDRLTARLEDGETIYLDPPDPPQERLRELRAGMYEPRKGTWFSAEYAIVRPGRYSVDFDYDNEPDFGAVPLLNFKPTATIYADDLKWFPRDDEHIPDWLRQKINEAEASEQA
jgi:hypothetical protein